MGIPPISTIGTSPIIYNVRRTNTPVRSSVDSFVKQSSVTLDNIKESGSRRRFDTIELSSDETPKDFKAIDLIKKSTDTTFFDKNVRNIKDVSYTDRDSQTTIEEKLIENSATFKTSDVVAKESSPSKLTPSQQQGIEVYQRFQNYSSPINLSNARIAV